jgi:hypothetical protein
VAAHKLRIKDIHAGTFSLQERPPHTITTNFGTFTEVRICGTVVSTYMNDTQSYGTIVVDDATDTIALKFWRERVPLVQSVQPGDILDVIGTVSEYNEELYLSPVAFYKKDLPSWIAFHLDIASRIRSLDSAGTWVSVAAPSGQERPGKQEYGETQRSRGNEAYSEAGDVSYDDSDFEEESLIFDDDEITRAVLDAIETDGSTKDAIISKTGLDDIDVTLSIKELLESGDIFEVDGTYKRL